MRVILHSTSCPLGRGKIYTWCRGRRYAPELVRLDHLRVKAAGIKFQEHIHIHAAELENHRWRLHHSVFAHRSGCANAMHNLRVA